MVNIWQTFQNSELALKTQSNSNNAILKFDQHQNAKKTSWPTNKNAKVNIIK